MGKIGKALRKAGLIAAGEAALGALGLYAAESAGEGVRLGHDRQKPGFLRGVREAVANYVGEFHPEDFITKELPTTLRYFTNPTKALDHVPLRIEQDAAPMQGTLVWQGFRLAYRDLPHRLTWVESRIDGIQSGDNAVEGSAAVAFEGGDWSRVDGNLYETRALAVFSHEMKFVHLSETLSVCGGRAVKKLQIDLKALGVSDLPAQAVFLRGFSVDTSAQHPDGMTIKGLGVHLEPRGRSGDVFSADLVVDFKAGPVAFRPDPGYEYEVKATVYYTLAAAASACDFVDAPAHYMLRNRERAPERVQQVRASCGADRAAVAPAIRGFTFDLHTTRARFVREMQLLLGHHTYDAATGEATVLCDAYFSNMGTAAGALDVRFSADLLMLCLPPGARCPDNAERIAGGMDAVTENQAYPVRVEFF